MKEQVQRLLAALARAIEDVETALARADSRADPLFRARCRYLLRVLRVSQAIVRAFYVNCREKCWDLYKGPWADHRTELRTLFADIQKAVAADATLYAQLARLEGRPPAEADPLRNTAAAVASLDVDAVTSSRDGGNSP